MNARNYTKTIAANLNRLNDDLSASYHATIQARRIVADLIDREDHTGRKLISDDTASVLEEAINLMNVIEANLGTWK